MRRHEQDWHTRYEKGQFGRMNRTDFYSSGHDDLKGSAALVSENALTQGWQPSHNGPYDEPAEFDHLKGSAAFVEESQESQDIVYSQRKEARARHDHLVGASALVENNGQSRPLKIQVHDHLLGAGSLVQGVVTPNVQNDFHDQAHADHLFGASAVVVDDSSSEDISEDEQVDDTLLCAAQQQKTSSPVPKVTAGKEDILSHAMHQKKVSDSEIVQEKKEKAPPLPNNVEENESLMKDPRNVEELCDIVRKALRHSTAKILTLRLATQELRTHANPGPMNAFEVKQLLQRLRVIITFEEAHSLLMAAGCPQGIPSTNLSKLARLFVDIPNKDNIQQQEDYSSKHFYPPTGKTIIEHQPTLSHNLPVYKYVMTDAPIPAPRRAEDEYHHLESSDDAFIDRNSSKHSNPPHPYDLERAKLAQESLEFNAQLRKQVREHNQDSHRLALAIKNI